MSTSPATIEKDGGYAQSWYAATRVAEPPVAPLDGDREADICILGGGYSGWSAVLAPYFGKLVASAIAGGDLDFDRLTRLPVPRFPVRRLMRGPTQGVAMSLLALRDRL